ncbi:unnamed protein product [Trichobilharzia szidati]|nr:unnamed protein product [Trichobilharzia szidati]CAH8851607.1 unnamed protein product [Trichobilharzia szidati]
MKDVGQQQCLSPLMVQSSKINGWLVSRKLIQTDYPKKLREIDLKINDATNKSPEASVHLSENPSLYLGCKKVLDILSQTDTKTDFFGRSSTVVRAWADIVSLFQKNNLYLAEIGDSIHELSAVQVPRGKMFITERQKNLLDLRQKLREQNLNLSRKEELLEKVYKEFRVDVNEQNIKVRLLEEAENVLEFLTEFVDSLKSLDPALQLYSSFRKFILGGFQNDNEPEKVFECCPTLQLLIDSGHVLVFTWKNGYAPECVKESDDFIPLLLKQEREKLKQSSIEMEKTDLVAEDASLEPNEIVWDETEGIDFGPIDYDVIESIEIETENTPPMTPSGLTDSGNAVSSSISSEIQAKPTIASGGSARYLLDSTDGRKALLNDLFELDAFLQRFQEDMHERLDHEGGGNQLSVSERNTTGSSGNTGCDTLQNMVMQNAPQDIQSCTWDELNRMIQLVKEAQDKLTTSSLSQLMMIRTRTGYLDRLTDRLLDYRRQVTLAKTRVSQTQHLIDKTIKEQEEKTIQLHQHRESCIKLVTFFEEELSRICNRQVQIIGQFCDV